MDGLALFPDATAVEDGELSIGGVGAAALAEEFGTPLVVYCERTISSGARAYREAAPSALVVYGTKAFPNVAVMRLLVQEGLGADVSTLGELRFALAAGVPADRMVVHGNTKSDAELRAAAEADAALLVLDSVEELARAQAAGVPRMLARVTPGIEPETHEAIRTGHLGSKFGMSPEEAVSIRDDLLGVHVHVGSQLFSTRPAQETVEWLNGYLANAGWEPEVVDLGGGLGVPTNPDERAPSVEEFVGALLGGLDTSARVVLEPGRSLLARAGVTLYWVGSVKRSWVAVDGGMSDNPRPQLYGARYWGLIANRAGAAPTETFGIAGKHCESGDVLIREIKLAAPERGDLLAVPATGAYTLAMSSTYNAVPRPAAVLVSDGDARLIRRRETVDDLLAFEA